MKGQIYSLLNPVSLYGLLLYSTDKKLQDSVAEFTNTYPENPEKALAKLTPSAKSFIKKALIRINHTIDLYTHRWTISAKKLKKLDPMFKNLVKITQRGIVAELIRSDDMLHVIEALLNPNVIGTLPPGVKETIDENIVLEALLNIQDSLEEIRRSL